MRTHSPPPLMNSKPKAPASRVRRPAKRSQESSTPAIRPDFPLWKHPCGYWAKKIRSKVWYFTRWAEDPQGKAAERQWNEQKDDIQAGRSPRARSRGLRGAPLTIARLCDHFINAKEEQRDAGDIRRATFDDYHKTCRFVVHSFGRHRLVDDLNANDF